MVMVVCAGFMCLAQTTFAAQRFGQDSAVYVWMVFCMLVAFAIGFLLLARSRYPRATHSSPHVWPCWFSHTIPFSL